MSELDDLFRQDAAASSSFRTTEPSFDKEAWVQKKQEACGNGHMIRLMPPPCR